MCIHRVAPSTSFANNDFHRIWVWTLLHEISYYLYESQIFRGNPIFTTLIQDFPCESKIVTTNPEIFMPLIFRANLIFPYEYKNFRANQRFPARIPTGVVRILDFAREWQMFCANPRLSFAFFGVISPYVIFVKLRPRCLCFGECLL